MQRAILSLAMLPSGSLIPLEPATDQPLRVLFIGNSLTYYHDLPGIVARLGASDDPALAIEAHGYTQPGATLKQHCQDPVALAAIRSKKKWDFVVLQEQGSRPATDRKAMLDAARVLSTEIENHQARPLLFLTWPTRTSPELFTKIAESYVEVGKQLKCGVIPVGHAWVDALKERPELELHEADGGHPAPIGSYLSACVIYGALGARKVEGLGRAEVKGLDPKLATWLQSVAENALKAHPLPKAGRKH